jgi:hypothetical protein
VGKVVFENSTCTISGGMSAAGIGTGEAYKGRSQVGRLLFQGGNYNVIGNVNGAGIGTGYARYGNTSISSIIIEAGDFLVENSGGAGIGTGYSFHGQTKIDLIRFRGGSFVVHGSSNAPGIGPSSSIHGESVVGLVEINNSLVTAIGGPFAAGIGTGGGEHGPSSLDRLLIANSTISVTGWIGIGATDSGSLPIFDLGPSDSFLKLDCWPMAKSCISAATIMQRGSRLLGSVNSSTVFKATLLSDWVGIDFCSQYRQMAESEQFGVWPVLTFPSLGSSRAEVVTLTFHHLHSNYSRTVEFDASKSLGIAFTLQEVGEYGVDAVSASGMVELVLPGLKTTITVGDGPNVLEGARLRAILWVEEGLRVGTVLALVAAGMIFGVMLLTGGTMAFRRARGAKGDCAHTDCFLI